MGNLMSSFMFSMITIKQQLLTTLMSLKKHSYRYPTMTKTLGAFKLLVDGGEFTQSQIILIQGLKYTGKTTFLRMLFEMPKYNVSYKPQRIGFMMSGSNVRDLLLDRIPDAFADPQFRSLVFKPLLIHQLMEQDIVNLSDAQLQRLELCLCLGKPADIYLLDEPTAYLNDKERLIASKVIQTFILSSKKTAFMVESEHNELYLEHQVILCHGKPASDCYATPPSWTLTNIAALAELMKDKTLAGKIMSHRI